MRLRTYVGVALVLVGCSSAATLPSGGPYGGAAGDAGVSVGGQVDAGSGIVFDPGGGASSSSGGIIIIGSSSGTGATVTSGSSIVTTSASSATMGATSSSGSTNAPTWTDLYNTYLSDATTTIGDCDGSCHYHTECSSASACYSWIGTGKVRRTEQRRRALHVGPGLHAQGWAHERRHGRGRVRGMDRRGFARQLKTHPGNEHPPAPGSAALGGRAPERALYFLHSSTQ